MNSNMNKKGLKGFVNSFRCAVRGIVYCVRHERNLRIHIVAMLYVLYFSSFYGFTRADYAVLVTICALVIGSELLNTSIEVVIDKVSPKFNVFAMIGKDIAAGAVFVSAAAAVIAGVMLFFDIDAFGRIFEFFTSHWLPPLVLAASLVLSVLFICSSKQRGSSHGRKSKD